MVGGGKCCFNFYYTDIGILHPYPTDKLMYFPIDCLPQGVLWVNDFCLGRYWPTDGPQMSLYLPGSRLRAQNTVTVLELEKVKPEHSMRLEARPRWKRASGPFHTMSASDNILVRDVDSK